MASLYLIKLFVSLDVIARVRRYVFMSFRMRVFVFTIELTADFIWVNTLCLISIRSWGPVIFKSCVVILVLVYVV